MQATLLRSSYAVFPRSFLRRAPRLRCYTELNGFTTAAAVPPPHHASQLGRPCRRHNAMCAAYCAPLRFFSERKDREDAGHTDSERGKGRNDDVENYGAGSTTEAVSCVSTPAVAVDGAAGEIVGTWDDDDLHQGGDSAPHTFSCSDASPSAPETLQTEPSSVRARAALEQRRQLFAASTALAEEVQRELRAEVERDMKDGAAAVPPLAPSGWRVLHSPGSCYFTMSRTTHASPKAGRFGGGAASIRAQAQRGLRHGVEGLDAEPRFRSVHDQIVGARRGGRPPNSISLSPEGADDADLWVRHRSSDSVSSRDGFKDARGEGYGPVHRESSHFARSVAQVTVFAPFRSLDLSLLNPRVDICEWSRFDVLIRKEKPKGGVGDRSSASTMWSTPLEGQQEVWDEGRCMFVRFACVNSELRIRSLQFVSRKLARALEEHAVFGKGEPLYLELLRRLRREAPVPRSTVPHQNHRGGVSPHNSTYEAMSFSPVDILDAPQATPQRAAASPPQTHPLPQITPHAADVLTTRFDRCGEYARTFVYAGPYITELSKELREALLEYLMVNMGITNEVAEYICQLQYYLEQEEYVGWLAQWGQLAATLKQTL